MNPYLIQSNNAITVDLPWPPSVNHYWRSVVIKGRVRMLVSKRGKQYQSEVSGRMVTLRKRFTERVAVYIAASPPDRRKRDLDNTLKATLDALTRAGAMVDDSQIDDLHIVRGPVAKGGRIVVTVSEIETANGH